MACNDDDDDGTRCTHHNCKCAGASKTERGRKGRRHLVAILSYTRTCGSTHVSFDLRTAASQLNQTHIQALRESGLGPLRVKTSVAWEGDGGPNWDYFRFNLSALISIRFPVFIISIIIIIPISSSLGMYGHWHQRERQVVMLLSAWLVCLGSGWLSCLPTPQAPPHPSRSFDFIFCRQHHFLS